MPNGGDRGFWHGEPFTYKRTFAAGTVRLQGMVRIDRQTRTLLLWDVDLRPVPGDRIEIGPASVRLIFAEICALAAAEGFDTMIVSGYRISGAHPDRFIELPFDCRPFRSAPHLVDTTDPT